MDYQISKIESVQVITATWGFNMSEIPDKSSARISHIFNNIWFTHYPRPWKIMNDNRSESKTDFVPLLKDFYIKPIPTTIKNPYTSANLGRDRKSVV